MNPVCGSHTSQSHSGPPASKRPHLDSGETGLWPFTSKNKPVGIAQPFQKKESVEVELVDKREDVLKLEQGVDLKPEVSLDLKAKSDKDVSSKDAFCFNIERTSMVGKKVSGKRHSSTESDSDSDSSSSFSYPFEPPSESSDDAVLARGDKGEQNVVLAENTSGEGGGRKEEPTEFQTSGRSNEYRDLR